MLNLTTTQRRIIACSLEIDGRPGLAARAAIGGHILEHIYQNGAPYSPKAHEVEELEAAIVGAVELIGLEFVISALRA